MNKLFKYGLPVLAGLIIAGSVYAVSVFNSQQLAPSPQNGNCLTTNGANPGVNAWSSNCGSGGGGSASSSPPNNSLQYNNSGAFGGTSFFRAGTGSYELGINSSTPNANLVVQGTSTAGTLPILVVASSSNTSFLTVASNGSTTISSLGAGCVNSTSAGALFVATCASGSGSGTISTSTTAQIGRVANWTGLATLGNGALIDNSVIAGVNASSSTVTFNVQGNSGAFEPFNIASSSGTSYLRVTQAGNVGIGTTNPTGVNANAHLTVAGISSQDIIASTTDNTTLSDAILQAYAPQSRVFLGAHGGQQVSTRYGITLGGWGELGAFNNGSTTNGLIIGVQPTAPIVFGTNNLERMRINANGSVSIGTTTVWATLGVQAIATTSTSFYQFDIASSSGASQLMVASSGNVGIGTTTPGQVLVVIGSTTLTSLGAGCVNSTVNGGLFVATCATGTHTGNGTNGQVAYYTAATVLTSASSLLNNGTVVGINASSSTINFNVQGTTTLDPFNVASSSGTSILIVKQSGKVGIGLTSPAAALDILGIKSTTQTSVFNVLGGVGITGSTGGQTITLTSGAGKTYTTASPSIGSGGLNVLMGGGGGDYNDSTLGAGSFLAGSGSSWNVQGGNGGNMLDSPNNAATTIRAGTGGGLLFIGGQGGDADFRDLTNTTGGNAGSIQFTTGFGGNASSKSITISGNSGAMTFTSSNAGSAVGRAAGTAVTGGTAGGFTVQIGNGGVVTKVGAMNAAAVFTGGLANDLSFIAGGGGSATSNGAGTQALTVVGGKASDIFFTGANGGDATGGTGTNTGGAGTILTFTSGKGGTGATAAGTDGNILFKDGYSNTVLSILGNNTQKIGINSTTPNGTLVVEGTSTSPTLDIFQVASSTNSVLFKVAANGSTTLSSLGAGNVLSTASGSLYINGQTGTGLNVLQTSPTLVTPILGVASGTSLSISGILWGNGQTNLTTASATSVSVSANLWDKNNNKVLGGYQKSFWLASTTITTIYGNSFGAGTTTLSVMGPPYAATLQRLACQTEAGNVNVQAGTGVASSTSLNVGTGGASSTGLSVLLAADATTYIKASSTNTTADGLKCTLFFVPQ